MWSCVHHEHLSCVGKVQALLFTPLKDYQLPHKRINSMFKRNNPAEEQKCRKTRQLSELALHKDLPRATAELAKHPDAATVKRKLRQWQKSTWQQARRKKVSEAFSISPPSATEHRTPEDPTATEAPSLSTVIRRRAVGNLTRTTSSGGQG